MQECFTIAWPSGSPCGEPADLDLARESRAQAASGLCPRERRSLTNLIRGTGRLPGREVPRLFWGRKEWQQDWKEVADRLIPERFTGCIELHCVAGQVGTIRLSVDVGRPGSPGN